MYKELFQHVDLNLIGEAGMLMFFGIFIAVTIYAVTRRRPDLDYWAKLPLAGTTQPQNPREEGSAL